MSTITVENEITLRCSCGAPLEGAFNRRHTDTLNIEPCKDCMKQAADDVREEMGAEA